MQIQDAHIKLIRESFSKVKDKRDLVDLFHLGENLLFGEQQPKIKLNVLTYYAHPYRAKKRYHTFTIKKKNGKDRIINAPNKNLKYILWVLNFILQAATTPHRAATGFVLGKSIVDNARMHIGKRFVYNIDLKDFFHSFERKRVKSVFMQKPFNFTGDKEPLAYMLSGLVTHPIEIDGKTRCVLPQGSPVSPTLTNLLSKKLDRRLTGLANRFGLTYTRYADDISFSSNHNVYRKKEFLDELDRIIKELDLEINPEKTRLQYMTYRQETTGLTVNEKVNVKRRYIKQIRQWLYFWERYGYEKAQALFLKKYKADKGHIKKGKPDLQNVLDGKLLYLKMVKGITDPTYIKLQNRLNQLVLNISVDEKNKEYKMKQLADLASQAVMENQNEKERKAKELADKEVSNNNIEGLTIPDEELPEINPDEKPEEPPFMILLPATNNYMNTLNNLVAMATGLGIKDIHGLLDIAKTAFKAGNPNATVEELKDFLSDVMKVWGDSQNKFYTSKEVRDTINTVIETEHSTVNPKVIETKEEVKQQTQEATQRIKEERNEKGKLETSGREVIKETKKPEGVIPVTKLNNLKAILESLKELIGTFVVDKNGIRYKVVNVDKSSATLYNMNTQKEEVWNEDKLLTGKLSKFEDSTDIPEITTGLIIDSGKYAIIPKKIRYKALKGKYVVEVDENGNEIYTVEQETIPEPIEDDYIDWKDLVNPEKNSIGREFKFKVIMDPEEWKRIKLHDNTNRTFSDWINDKLKETKMSLEEFMQTDEFIGNVPILYTNIEDKEEGEEYGKPVGYMYNTNWFKPMNIADPITGKRYVTPTKEQLEQINKLKTETLELRKKVLNGKITRAVVKAHKGFPYIKIPLKDKDGNIIPAKTLSEVASNAELAVFASGTIQIISNNEVSTDDIDNHDEFEKHFKFDSSAYEEEITTILEAQGYDRYTKEFDEAVRQYKIDNPTKHFGGKGAYLMPIRKGADGRTKYHFFPVLALNEDNEYRVSEEIADTITYVVSALERLSKDMGPSAEAAYKAKYKQYAVSESEAELIKNTINRLYSTNAVNLNKSPLSWINHYLFFNKIKYERELQEKIKSEELKGKELEEAERRLKDLKRRGDSYFPPLYVMIDARHHTTNNMGLGDSVQIMKPVKIERDKNGEIKINDAGKNFVEFYKNNFRTNVMSYKVGEKSIVKHIPVTDRREKIRRMFANEPTYDVKIEKELIHTPAVQQNIVIEPREDIEAEKSPIEELQDNVDKIETKLKEREKEIEEAKKENKEIDKKTRN